MVVPVPLSPADPKVSRCEMNSTCLVCPTEVDAFLFSGIPQRVPCLDVLSPCFTPDRLAGLFLGALSIRCRPVDPPARVLPSPPAMEVVMPPDSSVSPMAVVNLVFGILGGVACLVLLLGKLVSWSRSCHSAWIHRRNGTPGSARSPLDRDLMDMTPTSTGTDEGGLRGLPGCPDVQGGLAGASVAQASSSPERPASSSPRKLISVPVETLRSITQTLEY
jgi:hypothetical protein